MSPLVAMLIGVAVGALFSGILLAASARRMRAAMVHGIAQRLGPVIERRAVALGLTLTPSTEVGVGSDGELQVAREDELARLMRLADAIEAQETSQIGYVDTLRISKDDVQDYLEKNQRKG